MTDSLKRINDISIYDFMNKTLTEQRDFLSGIAITLLKDPAQKVLLKKFLVMNVVSEIKSCVEEKSIFNITHHVSRLLFTDMKFHNRNYGLDEFYECSISQSDLVGVTYYSNGSFFLFTDSKNPSQCYVIDNPDQLREIYKIIHELSKYDTLGFVLMKASLKVIRLNLDHSWYFRDYGYNYRLKLKGWIDVGIAILALIPCAVLIVLEHMLFMAIKPLEMLYHKLFGNSYDAFIQKYIDTPDPDDAEPLKNINILKQARRVNPNKGLGKVSEEVLNEIVMFSCKKEVSSEATMGLFSSPKKVVDSRDLKENMEKFPSNSATSP